MVHVEEMRVSARGSGYGWGFAAHWQRKIMDNGSAPRSNCCVFVNMSSHKTSHPPPELVRPGKQVKAAAADWSSLLPWVPFGMVNGEWRWLRRRSSTCRSRLCEGACHRETEALTAAAWRYGRYLERAARHHRGARDDQPGPSKGAGGAEGSGSSRRR